MNLPIVIVPELYRNMGGVQMYSRHMIEALDTLFGRPIPVISRNDRRRDCPTAFLQDRRFKGYGNWSAKIRRLGVVGSCATSSTPAFISTHPHFATWLRYQRNMTKQPFLSVAHGIDVWNIAGSRIAKGLQGANVILPVSQYTEDKLRGEIKANLPPTQILTNTFDDKQFYPAAPVLEWRERLRVDLSTKVLLSICRLDRSETEKGYDKILDIMPELLATHPDVVWVLGGRGNDLDRVKVKAEKLGVSNACRFPGFIPDEELADLYRSSDLFVLPSKKEGFGIVFLEAAACGLPVIAGNLDGSVDALAHGELGLLIDPDSREELLRAITHTLEQNNVEPTLLHRACVEKFGKEAFRNRLRAIIHKHLGITSPH